MSTHSREGENWLNSKICPVCGKEFHVLYPQAWGYKRNTGKNKLYYCSWSCMRKEETERNEMKKLTLEQKKKAVQIAVDGGNPLGFLESLGIRNSAEAWGKIKNHLKEYDPDTYAKLPKRLPQRTRTVSAPAVRTAEEPKPENVELVYDPGIEKEYRAEQKAKKEGTPADAIQGMTEAATQFFGACEDMGLKMETPEKPKITRPVNYDGLDVVAVHHPVLGEFYHDRKYNYIDWTNECGDEVSMRPEIWKLFVAELPKIMAVLGVNLE